MKKILLTLCLSIILIGNSACANKTDSNSVDYSKVENWYKCEYTGTNQVDTIFFYPTSVMNGETTTIDQCREGVKTTQVYTKMGSVYSASTNIYMPLYRQIPLEACAEFNNKTFVEEVSKRQGYKDACDSLDYYFAHFNNDKPFILAGHSQGSALLNALLKGYFQQHSQYLTKMVVCYAIGYGYSKSEIGNYSNLKFATGETDTGCIVSYNTYGPEHTGESILLNDDCYCINPLNWRTDNTYAPIELNLGSFVNGVSTEGLSDAQIDVNKGYVVSTASTQYEVAIPYAANLFGTHSFHGNDYGFYYENLKDNISKRIASFKGVSS